jgi:putative flavoprotein involved in K+ transport
MNSAPKDTEPLRGVAAWLDAFNGALESSDPAAVAMLFAETSFWRDLVALT